MIEMTAEEFSGWLCGEIKGDHPARVEGHKIEDIANGDIVLYSDIVGNLLARLSCRERVEELRKAAAEGPDIFSESDNGSDE